MSATAVAGPRSMEGLSAAERAEQVRSWLDFGHGTSVEVRTRSGQWRCVTSVFGSLEDDGTTIPGTEYFGTYRLTDQGRIAFDSRWTAIDAGRVVAIRKVRS